MIRIIAALFQKDYMDVWSPEYQQKLYDLEYLGILKRACHKLA